MAKNKTNTKNKGVSVEDEYKLYHEILPQQMHEPGLPVCLVIDGMSFAHTAYHAYNKLSYMGKSVSMIFGVPQIIKRYLVQEKPEKVVVCWDGINSARRQKWLPGYKEHRKKNRDPKARAIFEKEIDRLRILLYRMGIAQAYHPKVEGDDMVHLIAKRESLSRPVIILSGDKDMLQLVNFDIRVINPRNDRRHNLENFSLLEPYVRVDQIVDYISLMGDTSDDIPGIKGIGPSKACSFLRVHDSFKKYMQDEDALFPGIIDKDKANITMKRNRKMIDIKWYCSKFHTKKHWVKYFKDKANPVFDDDAYIRFCTKWNLRTMLLPAFKKPFQNL